MIAKNVLTEKLRSTSMLASGLLITGGGFINLQSAGGLIAWRDSRQTSV